MKGKYVTTQVLLACLSKPQSMKKDIHTQLATTIAELERTIRQLNKFLSREGDDSFGVPGKMAA